MTMEINELAFDTKETFEVDFELNDQKLRGKLILNPDELIRLEIVNDKSLYHRKQKIDYIQCIFQNSKMSLYECDISGSYIYPQYIIFGDTLNNKFDGFKVCIGGLSCYFKDQFSSPYDNGEFNYKFNKGSFNISLPMKDRDIEISDDWSLRIRSKNGISSDITISERHIFIYEFNKPQPLKQIRADAEKLKLMFSLLTMIGLNIDYMWVTTKDNELYPIVFSIQRNNKKLDFDRGNSLINWDYFNNTVWHQLFSNVYSNERFSNLWPALIGMYLYTGYWEYNFLGTVSLFDAYVSDRYKSLDKKRAISKKLKKTIKTTLGSLASDFDIQDKKEFEEIKNNLSFFISGENLTLIDKYNFLMNEINEDIRNSFGMGIENFSILKKLRDKIAHGNRQGLKDIVDFTFLIILKNRLLVFLTYLALKDMGMCDKRYAESAVSCYNNLLIASKPQKKWLDKYLNSYDFYHISSYDYETLGDRYFGGIVLSGDSDGEFLSYNRALANIIKCIENNRNIKSENRLVEFSKKILSLGYKNYSLNQPYKIYVQCGEEFKEIYAPIILYFHD